MGVQFIELTPQQREQIVNLVRTFAYLSDDEEPKGNSQSLAPEGIAPKAGPDAESGPHVGEVDVARR